MASADGPDWTIRLRLEKGHHSLKRGAVKVLAIEGAPEPERLLPTQSYRNVQPVFQFRGDLRIHVTAIHQTFQLEIAEWLLVMKAGLNGSFRFSHIFHLSLPLKGSSRERSTQPSQ